MSITEKTSWKSIPITLNSSEGGRLICFEELTDYEVVLPKTEAQNFLSKKEKRKQQRLLDYQAKKQRLMDEDLNSEHYDQSIADSNNNSKTKVSRESQSDGKKIATKKKKKNTRMKKNTAQSQIVTEPSSDQPVTEDIDMSSWDALLVPEEIIKALKEMAFSQPTEIQEQVIRTAIQTKLDIVAAAETGSGKTLAFGIPMLYHMMDDRARGFLGQVEAEEDDDFDLDEEVEDCEMENIELNPTETLQAPVKNLPALILTPTRELAMQVKDHMVKAGKYTDFKMVAIVGGMSVQKQERLLGSEPDIIIATPGRLWEFIEQGHSYLLNLHRIRYLVIDEADRMLEKGHFAELVKILNVVNKKRMKNVKRQTYMFSATLTTVHSAPNRQTKGKVVTKLVKLETLMKKIGIRENKHVVDLTTNKGTAKKLYEARIICSSEEKDLYLYYFMRSHPGRTLVFTNSIDCIFHLTGVLQALSLTPLHLHAKMQQRQRLKHLERFRANKDSVLIASDVAARGLDIPDVQHVVHYQVPRTCETYIHRSGRSARTGKEGLSLLLISPQEISLYKRLCHSLKLENGISQFPVEERSLAAVKKIVKLAKEVDALGHKKKKVRLNNDWFSKAAAEMDIELDDDMLMKDHQSEETRVLLERKQKQLNNLLKQSIIPKQVSGNYLTRSETLTMPGVGQSSAIEQFKKVLKK